MKQGSLEKSGYTQSKIYGCDSAGKIVFSTVDASKKMLEQEANAALIVRVVNVHDDLVKACTEAVAFCHRLATGTIIGGSMDRENLVTELKAALKKAGGEV